MISKSLIASFISSLVPLEALNTAFTKALGVSITELWATMLALNIRRINLSGSVEFYNEEISDNDAFIAVALDNSGELVALSKFSAFEFQSLDNDIKHSILTLLKSSKSALTDPSLISSLPLYPNDTHVVANIDWLSTDGEDQQIRTAAGTKGRVIGARHDPSGPIYSIEFGNPGSGWVFYNPLVDGPALCFVQAFAAQAMAQSNG